MKRVFLAGALAVSCAVPASAASITAYEVKAGTTGNQAYSGILSMLFEANTTITVDALGAFDDYGDGISGPLTTELWSRNGTSGMAILASKTFDAADPGTLDGGSRIKALDTALVLAPGSYAIVSYGFGANDKNGNWAYGSDWTVNDGVGALSFVAHGRYGGTPGAGIGAIPEPSYYPANAYAAGTFTYSVGLSDVPVPASLPLLAGAAALFGLVARRRA